MKKQEREIKDILSLESITVGQVKKVMKLIDNLSLDSKSLIFHLHLNRLK